jgi:hypothetical protein
LHREKAGVDCNKAAAATLEIASKDATLLSINQLPPRPASSRDWQFHLEEASIKPAKEFPCPRLKW